MTPRLQPALLAAASGLAVAAWAAGWVLPWISLAGSGETVDRGMLASSAVGYERALVVWPAVTLPAMAAIFAALAIAQARGLVPRWAHAAWLAVAAAGLLSAVAGMRLVGFAAVRALDPGAALVRPGPAALATLAAGAAALALAAPALARARTSSPWSAVAASATLLLLPLLPFGRSGSGTFHYDELTLAATASSGGILALAAQALAWTRGALWAAVAGGFVALAWGPAPAAGRQPWLLAAVAAGPLAAVALWAVFQVRWAQVDGLGLSWNPVLPVGCLASLALLAWPVRAALGPAPKGPQALFKDDPQ